MSMELVILAPDHVVIETRVVSIQASDASGSFGIRNGHEDFLTVLVPCVFRFQPESGTERFAAVDGGVLMVERGRISVTTRDAVVADRIEQVADAASSMLAARRGKESSARSAFAELESTLLRELGKAVHHP